MASNKETTRGKFIYTTYKLYLYIQLWCIDSTQLIVDQLKRETKVTDQQLDTIIEQLTTLMMAILKQ